MGSYNLRIKNKMRHLVLFQVTGTEPDYVYILSMKTIFIRIEKVGIIVTGIDHNVFKF